MSWVKLDDNFESHPKILAVGLPGAGLYARALSYCGRQRTDGFVPSQWVAGQLEEPAHKKLPQRLVDARLWDRVEGGYFIRDYVEMNPTRAELEERGRRRREAGKRAAEARWSDAKSHGSTHPERIDADMQPEPEPEPESTSRPGE